MTMFVDHEVAPSPMTSAGVAVAHGANRCAAWLTSITVVAGAEHGGAPMTVSAYAEVLFASSSDGAVSSP